MRLTLSIALLFLTFSVNAQAEKSYWKLKREFPLYNNAWWKLKFRDGMEDFKTVKILDFQLTKDSSFIGAWTPAYSRDFFEKHDDGEIIIEQYYSLNDTVYKNIYHVKSDSIWLDWLNMYSEYREFYLKEYYQGKPILQGYLPSSLNSLSSSPSPQKLDYFYAISADDSSMITYRKTHSFVFSFDTLFEKYEKAQTAAHYELLKKMKELTEAKDIETKKMIYEMGKLPDCKEATQFINDLGKNIENYLDTKEALTKCISIDIKCNDAFSVLQQNIKKKNLSKAKDLNTIGWYKIPVSIFKYAHIRLFEKNGKYYAAIINDFNMNVLEVIKSEESKGNVQYTPIVEDDFFHIQHFTTMKKNKILSLTVKGQSNNYESHIPKYDEWYCDIFFGEPTQEMLQKKYPWL